MSRKNDFEGRKDPHVSEQEITRQLFEQIEKKEPLRTVQTLKTFFEHLKGKEKMLEVLRRVIAKIEAECKHNYPEEPLPKGLSLQDADQLRLLLLEVYNQASVEVEDAAEATLFKLTVILREIYKGIEHEGWGSDKVVKSLELVENWYKRHTPSVGDLINQHT